MLSLSEIFKQDWKRKRGYVLNIPDKVRIDSNDYAVKLTDETLIVDHEECTGMIDYQIHEIKIKKGIQDKQGEEVTFLHEVVHGIVHERNFTLEGDDNELKVEELARGLHQFIRDNPNIVL
jgi:hypothetical protein